MHIYLYTPKYILTYDLIRKIYSSECLASCVFEGKCSEVSFSEESVFKHRDQNYYSKYEAAEEKEGKQGYPPQLFYQVLVLNSLLGPSI